MAPNATIFAPSPATLALELAKAKADARRGSLSSVDSKLSVDLAALTFESDAFPVIQWDNIMNDSDSDSVRSNDSWNSLFGSDACDSDSDSETVGSKRGRDEGPSSRRLVRSKVIKSDLASLARSMNAQSA